MSSSAVKKKRRMGLLILLMLVIIAFVGVGIFKAFMATRATKIPVLCYHNVVSDEEEITKAKSIIMHQSLFEEQMQWLEDNGFRTISCDEFYDWYNGKRLLPRKSVLITFDDGSQGVADYALPVLEKHNMKACVFIIGERTSQNVPGTISMERMKEIQKEYPDMEFQSHTFALHCGYSKESAYDRMSEDAAKEYEMFGFEYIAYPYGRKNEDIARACSENHIKAGFIYGEDGYATRDQNIYLEQRIKVDSSKPFDEFTKWLTEEELEK